MKYIRGYVAAAVLAAVTWALMQFAKTHTRLVDMIYPFFTRLIQTSLADWTGTASFCLWQVIAVLLVAGLVASVIAMVIIKWNPIQWFGWVLAGAALLFLLHTGIYGLNSYAGTLAEDIRLQTTEYTVSELARATTYYRDQANELALQIPRNSRGKPQYPSFEELAEMAGSGFENLTMDYSYSVFAGSTVPVKKLGWTQLYDSMGIDGVTMPLTGEAAVNPHIPVVAQPFTMCHEMAHRMCIAYERDANMSGFLACMANDNVEYQYSGYFMAFRYCYNALVSVSTSTAQAAAKEIRSGINSALNGDLADYKAYYAEAIDTQASNTANQVNNTYIQVSGDSQGVKSYGEVCDLLVSWHIQTVYLPEHREEEQTFDPLDKTQVDLG